VAELLALNHVTSCATNALPQLAVEAYDVQRVSLPTRAGRESINPDQSVKVAVRPRKIDVPAGALFVPMNQPAAGIVAAALEPDSPGSYVGVGVVPGERRRERGAGISRHERPGRVQRRLDISRPALSQSIIVSM
jgi:hypothetical protein